MPDMDLQTSLTLLIAAALTGGFLIIWLAFSLVYPGLVFGLSVKDDKFTVKQLVLTQLIWFVLPMTTRAARSHGIMDYKKGLLAISLT